ncbi:glycosyltransferase family 2 protein [Thalassorhabdomicrobium marinisediminis]|uniref:glycosyltransferase family 2 protein n=1 Tax=Thalassorhabdomicrobium marinisediminis TaxID=2170577 RepID=UPI002491F9B8|nr:glycosyltransferase [Thalassorhabdomicrobium marinisediminis]
MGDPAHPDISVIIRAHDPARLHPLTEAVRSVHDQHGGLWIEVILETSNFPDPLLLEDFVAAPSRRVSLRHHDMVHSGDSRVDLMRHGVRAARAPVLGFLDFDDTLTPMGLSLLHGALCADRGANLMIGNIDLAHKSAADSGAIVPYHSEPPTVAGLMRRNSVPIHSYLVRSEVARRAVARVPALTLYEDYAFLLAAMEQGGVRFLDPFTSVGRYNIDRDQAVKYRDVEAFSADVIARFAATLEVPVPVSELRAPRQSPSGQKALTAMLDAMPETRAPHVVGLVETQPQPNRPARPGHPEIVAGWVCNVDAPEDVLWGVYALTEAGDYVHLHDRDDRSDVAAELGVPNGPYGFSGAVSTGNIKGVFVVIGNRKLRLPDLFAGPIATPPAP